MAADRLTLLISSSAVSNLGDGVGKVAFPLLAATLTHDPVLVGGLSATQFLPWLLFALPAGTLLDRVDRRRAVLAANTGRAVLVAGTGLLVLTGTASIWMIYAAAFVLGTAETVADSASNVLIPSVVEPGKLDSANSRLQSTEVVGQSFLGGPVGSLTFALFAAAPFFLNAAGFGLAAALFLRIGGRYRPGRSGQSRRRDESVWAELAAGVRWVRGHPLMLRLVLTIGLMGLTTELAMAQLVLYALGDLRLSASAFGLFAAVAGAGGLAGASVAPRLIRRFGRGRVLVGGLCASGMCVTAMGLTKQPIFGAVCYGLFAVPVMAVNVVLATVRHSLVPGELLGRVLGVWKTVVWGSIPLGALAGGLLTAGLGSPSATFVVSGLLQLGVAVFALASVRGHGAGVLTRAC